MFTLYNVLNMFSIIISVYYTFSTHVKPFIHLSHALLPFSKDLAKKLSSSQYLNKLPKCLTYVYLYIDNSAFLPYAFLD